MDGRIKVYGNSWCPDSRRARKIFESMGCDYDFIDVDKDEAAKKLVKEINHGYCSVPTILFPDGSTLTEPKNQTLEEKIKSLSGV